MTALNEADLPADPLALFATWHAQAHPVPGLEQPMTLATATPDGRPSARQVLLKGFDARGFVFFTGYRSRKGREIAANPLAALVIHWPGPDRQVRIEGRVERLPAAESDDYFRSRPPGSRIAAMASAQSEILKDRSELEARVRDLVERHRHAHSEIPRPEDWGGFRVIPEVLEFWQGRAHRLHDRIRYRRDGATWRIERLQP